MARKFDHYVIRLNNIMPPIPDRRLDWEAVLDGYDAGDPIGRGPDRVAAVADLMEQLEDLE